MFWAVGVFLHSLTIFLVAAFGVVCLTPPLHQKFRALIRPWVVHHVERGVTWVVAAQRLESPYLTHAFQLCSHVVGVPFYATFLPAIHMLGLPELCHRLVALMALIMYTGNAMKDMVCAPRPINARVPPGSTRPRFLGGSSEEAEKNAKEYGLPSSHTMNSIALNFYIIIYLQRQGLISDSTAAALYAVASVWLIWIAASRMYLGLHTPIDIIVGAFAGAGVLLFFLEVEGWLQWWVTHVSPSRVIAQHAIASLLLLRLHPKPLSPTPSYEFTTSFFGAFFGANVGVARTYDRFQSPAVQLARVAALGPWAILRRLALGFAMVVLAKEASKAFLHMALPQLYRLFPLPLRRLWQPPVHSVCAPGLVADKRLACLPHNAKGQPWDVDVTSRFFSYAGLGVAVVELAPWLISVLGW